MVRRYQTLHNAMFNATSWIFSVIVSFLFLPYIVHKLGTEAYGILVLVLSVVGYFAVLDLNLGDAVTKYVAEYGAEKNLKRINETVRGVILLYLVLGVLAGLGIFLLSETLVVRVLKIGAEFQPAAYFAFSIGSVGIIFTMLLTVLSAIPNGMNRYDISSKMTMLISLVTTLITVLLLYFRFGLREIIVMHIGVSIVGCILYIIIGKRLIPGLKLTPGFELTATKNVLKFGIFSSLSRISAIIIFHGTRLLTGAVLGASWVTYYVVPFTIVSKGTAVTWRLGMVIFPAISELQGAKRYDSIIDLYVKASRVILTVSISICLPLLIFGGRLLALWMGHDFGEKSSTVFFLLCLAVFFNTTTNVPTYVVDGLGKPKISGIAQMASAVLYLGLLTPLAKYMGINGVGVAGLISMGSVAPVFVWYVNTKVLHVPLFRLLKEAYARPVLAGLLVLIPLSAIPQHQVSSLFLLLGLIAMGMVGYLAVACLVGTFPRDERETLNGYLGLVSRSIYAKCCQVWERTLGGG